jgi:hypothetical protein
MSKSVYAGEAQGRGLGVFARLDQIALETVSLKDLPTSLLEIIQHGQQGEVVVHQQSFVVVAPPLPIPPVA